MHDAALYFPVITFFSQFILFNLVVNGTWCLYIAFADVFAMSIVLFFSHVFNFLGVSGGCFWHGWTGLRGNTLEKPNTWLLWQQWLILYPPCLSPRWVLLCYQLITSLCTEFRICCFVNSWNAYIPSFFIRFGLWINMHLKIPKIMFYSYGHLDSDVILSIKFG